MKLSLLLGVPNLIYQDEDIPFMRFKLSSSTSFLENELLLPPLKKAIGLFSVSDYKKHPYFFTEVEYNPLERNYSAEDGKIILDTLEIYLTVFRSLINRLWLIKDNCCSVNTIHASLSDSNHVMVRNAGLLNSNCEGKYHEQVAFTNEEINDAILTYSNTSHLFYHNNLKISLSSDSQPDLIIPRSITLHDYKKVTRIERAFDFLEFARTTNHLPKKIAFYMCIYETLFNGKNSGEIVHQIAERVALYAANARFMRNGIYKIIKDAYKIRSIYFHGNTFKNTKTDISKLSSQIDNLTRRVLKKVLVKDAAIFTQDDELLEKSFMDLIFEDTRKPYGQTFESGRKHLRFNEG